MLVIRQYHVLNCSCILYDVEAIEKVLKVLAGEKDTNAARRDYAKILREGGVSHKDLVKAMAKDFAAKKSMGLSEEEKLKIFAIFRGNPTVRDALEGHFSQATKEANKKLFEEVGTSFTSTANVAAYPVPVGMLYRKWLRGPKGDKRKKSV